MPPLWRVDAVATYAQLQAESWWAREIVTPELDWLGDELCRRTKRPRVAAGCKGDNHHLRGAHRSQEWILRSRYSTSRTYTVQSGLTATQQRHVSGFDFTPGSDTAMIAQCKRIYAAMRAGKLNEVREFYGNINGDKIVDGWDNVRDRPASSDSSHLWHWHLTLDRRHCANKHLMERVLATALGQPLEDDMPITDADAKKIALTVATWDYRNGEPVEEAYKVALRAADSAEAAKSGVTTLRTEVGKLGSDCATEFGRVADALGVVGDRLATIEANPPGTVVITDEQLERVLRKVIGSVDGTPPAQD